MDFELLRRELREAAPSREALLSVGVSGDEAESLIASFDLTPRDGPAPNSMAPGVLHRFFTRYDPSNLVVGMVRFLPAPEPLKGGWTIGTVEADPLVMDESSGEIIVIDTTAPGHVLWRCADGGEHFLSALVPAARFLGRRMVDDASLDDDDAKLALEECITRAGGPAYESFFQMLVGVE